MRQGTPQMLPLRQVSTEDYVTASELTTKGNADVITFANIGGQSRPVTQPQLQARSEDVETAPAAGTVPQYILQLIGDLDEIRLTAARFFEHIHQWMPFISKKRFYDFYLQPSFHSRPDVVLLLLALKLITTFLPAGSRSPRTALYNSTKQFYLKVEGSFSILVLQAGILVALYELGHGIYPAAFLSIGTCARYAHALGINVSRTVPTRRVLTLVEVEERRRVWWAIVILDRFVSIGCPGRPFATADPKLDDFLPADDAAWDQGIVKPDNFSTLSSPMTGHMSKFALLCQAARLLGQVLNHLSTDFTSEDDWVQLDRTLQSMLVAALNIDCPDYDQITFVYSALVALYTPWLSSDRVQEIDTDRSRRAKVILQQITDRISANLIERQCFLGRDPEALFSSLANTNRSAAESASSALQNIQSYVDQTTVRTASRVKSKTEAVAFKQDDIKESVKDLRTRYVQGKGMSSST
ncbi:Transcription factor, fungi [Penicillium expansum]|nr:Transcription factor, fungi [Penicillium expansum]KGO64836.1 Transcription factor, fungi [Penicillium expansum]